MKYHRLIIIVCLTLVIFACTGESETAQKINNKEFVKIEWLKGSDRVRGAMAQNLLDKKILIGKSKGEVIEILGTPDKESKDYIVYAVDMGVKFGDSPWPYYLNIKFDLNTSLVSDAIIND